jgi:hypothetical protein
VAFGPLDRIVRREPLASQGKSGSLLERAWLEDGSSVVIKQVDARQDWIMQATGDNGRIVEMWSDGIFARLPAHIEHGMLDVVSSPGGAVIAMADLSTLLPDDAVFTPTLHEQLLSATADMHSAFDGQRIVAACPLEAYYLFLSPRVCERFAADHDVPRLALEGWDRFADLVDDDIGAAIGTIHADPSRFVAALSEFPATLVHGDLKLANLGLDGERVVVLDWGTLTTCAPAAVDYAWYLAINAAAIGQPHDRLLDDVRVALGDRDAEAMGLALLGALAQLGWEKALGATSDDQSTQHRERAGLTWWVAQARAALNSWSP